MRIEERPWVPDFMYVDWERPHLGGYVKGGDPGSWCPGLWRWLIDRYDVESVIDIGCGEGHSVAWFAQQGYDVLGIDGIEQPDPFIVRHDFSSGRFIPDHEFDLAWCCEFVEHVEERYVENFLTTFEAAKVVAMTHGLPGQGGHHHVNCQPPAYWLERMKEHGFELDQRATKLARELTPNGYFDWSGLIFIRKRRRWPHDFRGFGTNVKPRRAR